MHTRDSLEIDGAGVPPCKGGSADSAAVGFSREGTLISGNAESRHSAVPGQMRAAGVSQKSVPYPCQKFGCRFANIFARAFGRCHGHVPPRAHAGF